MSRLCKHRANDSEFGLGGAVISQDNERCQRVAEALECGIVWINCSQPCFSQVGMRKGGGANEILLSGLSGPWLIRFDRCLITAQSII